MKLRIDWSLGIVLVTTMTASARTPSGSITFFTNSELRRAIQTAPAQPGQPGLFALRLSPPSEPEVVGIRRTAAARSELHDNVTDVWYVIDGKATLVTGGSMEGAVQTSPGEIRGLAITQGDRREIRKGDYAVIPAGVPHWISKVASKELLYIVVKVPIQNSPLR